MVDPARPDWNPYYSAYARSQGRSEADQLAYDRERNHLAMLPFTQWISSRLREFAESGGAVDSDGRIKDHGAWYQFITGQVCPIA